LTNPGASTVPARVTLDTNIYVSAFQFGSMRLLHMAVNGEIEVAVSQPILDELVRVLREKFQWDGYRLHAARQQVLGLAKLVAPVQTLDVVERG
jgi:predicted nucleic acid-binding protein